VAGTVPALKDALIKLVDAAHEAYRNGAPLSPITVYSVDAQDNYKQLFTGELAATKPEVAKKQIGERLDGAATPTPDFQTFIFQPEIKDNLASVIFVMDGALVTQGNKAQLLYLANQISSRNPANLAFFVTSSACDEWRQVSRSFECNPLAANVGDRRKALTNAFVALIAAETASGQDNPNGPGGARQ
jgi:hypothetical protein